QQRVSVKLDVVENFSHGVALDDSIQDHAAGIVEADVNGVSVAKKVVKIAKDFLIGAHQKDPEIIWIAVDGVQRQRPLNVLTIDEGIDLAVGVAGDIAENRMPRWRRVEAMNRHDRKQLIDCP